MLAANEIDSVIRNDLLQMDLGGLPRVAVAPEVWLLNPADMDRAIGVINSGLTTPQKMPAWTCPRCGESVEGPFDACWNCGADKPGSIAQ